MTVLLQCPWENANEWSDALTEALAPVQLVSIDDPHNAASVEFAIVWNPEPGILARYPNLRAVSSLGAGVDALLRDGVVPPRCPLTRLVDPLMADRMAAYINGWVLHFHLQLDIYADQAQRGEWRRHMQPDPHQTHIGFFGYGHLAKTSAKWLINQGFKVSAWANRNREENGVTCHSGAAGLSTLLAGVDIAVCLLPLTTKTVGLFNRETFDQMRPDAVLINCARGGHVIADDLLETLDRGHLRAAVLDVFTDEPLPATHAFWQHAKVHVTPHISSLSDVTTGSGLLAAQVHRALNGETLQNVVDRTVGY